MNKDFNIQFNPMIIITAKIRVGRKKKKKKKKKKNRIYLILGNTRFLHKNQMLEAIGYKDLYVIIHLLQK